MCKSPSHCRGCEQLEEELDQAMGYHSRPPWVHVHVDGLKAAGIL